MTPQSEHLFPGDDELAALMRSKDWSKTSLGPVETWSNGLRVAVRIVLTSRFSMWMAWGDELAFLYNDAYRRDTLGVKHPRALAMPFRELWSEVWADLSPRISRVLEHGEATWDDGLLLMLERNGYREETYHTFSYSPLYDDEGKVRGVLSVVTEETARLISERRVALLGRLGAETGTRNTIEGVAAGLEAALANDARDIPFTVTYMLDPDGTSLRLLSCTGFEATHQEPPPVLAVGDHPWASHEVCTAGAACEVALAPGAWPTGPWQVAPSHVYVVPLAERGQGRPAGVIVCGINPHRAFDAAYREFLHLFASQLASGFANARAYERERERAESLAALDRAKTMFFSNVSHELRTPLTLLLGPLDDMLADIEVPPSLRVQLVTMQRNGQRLYKLVNTMLDFSRIEAGRATVQFVPVALAQLTADLASVFRAATEKAGLDLVVECPPLAQPVEVDPDMWEKIVLNLISNAFKYTLHGEIRVRLAQRGDHVELTVSDTGCGIAEDQLPRVFERFHRVEGTGGRTHEGTGIGLALVQELVRLHRGTVSATSEVGRGSTFTVRLPMRAPGSDSVAQLHELGHSERQGPNAYVAEALRWLPDEVSASSAEPVPVTRAHLVVADDNSDMRAYLKRLFEPRWEVTTVRTGVEALAAIRERKPDLVVTDVMMPELDGFGLLAALRADRDLASLPVIMLSARAGEEARVEGLQAGANDYLVKPFASRELIARVESQLMRAAVRAAERDYERRFSRVFQQAPVALAILRGPTHIFEFVNPAYQAVVAGRDVVGKSLAEALPEVVSQGFVDLFDRVYATGEPYIGNSMPIQLMGEDGRLEDRVFDLVYQPTVDAAGEVTGIAAIGHDVTALAHARRDAELANRAKDEFLAMLGHELRNPLAPITTALQLMRQRSDVGAERERAVIERQVNHLVGLVDDLLDVSRITQGKIQLRREVVAVSDAISRAVELASPLFDQHRHTLTVDVAPGVSVHGDPARLAQILSNLLANAAKYTPDGGKIHVEGKRDGDEVVIRVVDNGIGIEAAMLDEIFAPFAQTKQSLARSQGGLGLGLAIVASLVRLHGGDVSARSDGSGKGSEFAVRLPALDEPRVATRHPTPEHASEPRHARVLVVDDNIDAAQLLADLLEASGYETATAFDGPSALRALERFDAQVAIVDLGLPVMDGFELARLIRERAGEHPKLVAVTGYGQAEDRARTRDAGFCAHFVKPVDSGALRTAIDTLLDSAS